MEMQQASLPMRVPAAPPPAVADIAFPEERPQTAGEELANSLSHGVGVVGGLAALPILIGHAGPEARTAVGVFAGTALILYSTSALYHALPRGRTKAVVRFIEHNAIFLLIAGTYTPFTLIAMRGAWGLAPFCIVWGLTAVAVVRKAFEGVRWSAFTTVLCLVLGWGFLACGRILPDAAFRYLVLGGMSYMMGLAFYAVDHRRRYCHFIWHLFVLAGTALHFIAIWLL